MGNWVLYRSHFLWLCSPTLKLSEGQSPVIILRYRNNNLGEEEEELSFCWMEAKCALLPSLPPASISLGLLPMAPKPSSAPRNSPHILWEYPGMVFFPRDVPLPFPSHLRTLELIEQSGGRWALDEFILVGEWGLFPPLQVLIRFKWRPH